MSNSFVVAAEQVCLQPVLEHRQRRGRRNIAWQAIPHHCSSNRKGTTSDSWPTTGRNVKLFSGGGPEPASVWHVSDTCKERRTVPQTEIQVAALRSCKTYLQRLLYDTNNKCIATIMLAKLIFSVPYWPKVRTFLGPRGNFRTSTSPIFVIFRSLQDTWKGCTKQRFMLTWFVLTLMPSVLWHCRLGGRKGI